MVLKKQNIYMIRENKFTQRICTLKVLASMFYPVTFVTELPSQ